jgi:hypothetical protein
MSRGDQRDGAVLQRTEAVDADKYTYMQRKRFVYMSAPFPFLPFLQKLLIYTYFSGFYVFFLCACFANYLKQPLFFNHRSSNSRQRTLLWRMSSPFLKVLFLFIVICRACVRSAYPVLFAPVFFFQKSVWTYEPMCLCLRTEAGEP